MRPLAPAINHSKEEPLPACRRRSARFFAVVISTLACVAAGAGGKKEAVEVEPIEPVEVVSEAIPEDSPETSSPTAAVSPVPIARTDASTIDLGVALRRAPGVALRRSGSPGSPMSTTIRGSAPDQIVVKLAGIPLTPPGGGRVDLSSVPPSLLESLIVGRGTEASVEGAGALGGVLHLEPLSPPEVGRRPSSSKDDGPRSTEDSGHSRRTVTFRADTLRSAGTALAWRGTEGSSRLAAGLDLHASEGHFEFERALTPNLPDESWTVQERDNNRAFLGTGLFSAKVPAGIGRLRLTAFGHRSRTDVAGMVGFPTPGARSDTSRALVGADFDAPVSGMRQLRWGAAAWYGQDGYSYDPGPSPAPGAGTHFDSGRRVLGARANAEMLALGTLLELNAEGSFEALKGTGVSTSRPAASISMASTSFLLRESLTLHGALRVDAFGGLTPAISPRAGARLALPASLSLIANIGRGVRMPALFELHGRTALVSSNPDLRPETAVTVDGGAEIDIDETATLRVTTWHSRYEDLISYELHPPLRLRPLNIGRATTRGLEAEASVRPASRLELSGAYTLTDTVNLSAAPNAHGRPLPYRPRHRGVGIATTGVGALTFEVSVEGQSKSPRNRANTKWLPGRVLVGAGAGAQLGKGLFASVEVTNLLDDRRLEDLSGYPLPGRALYLLFGFDG